MSPADYHLHLGCGLEPSDCVNPHHCDSPLPSNEGVLPVYVIAHTADNPPEIRPPSDLRPAQEWLVSAFPEGTWLKDKTPRQLSLAASRRCPDTSCSVSKTTLT